jgi:hypothetical protein
LENPKNPIKIPTNFKFKTTYNNTVYLFKIQNQMISYFINTCIPNESMSFITLKNLILNILSEIQTSNFKNLITKIQISNYIENLVDHSIKTPELNQLFIQTLNLHKKNEVISHYLIDNWYLFMENSKNIKSNNLIYDIINKIKNEENFLNFAEGLSDSESKNFLETRAPKLFFKNTAVHENHKEIPIDDKFSLKIEEHDY